jgi:outer membrane protein OmpA-like peptidoglycan-associated protein
MRKNFFLLLFLLNALYSFSQIKFGVIGGPQSSTILEKNSIAGWDTSTNQFYNRRSGLHLGMVLQIPISQNGHWFFEPSVIYSQKGKTFSRYFITNPAKDTVNNIQNDTLSYSYTKTQDLAVQYIDIPLNLLYKFPLSKKNKANLIVSAGPYISFYYKGNFGSTFRQSLINIDTTSGVLDTTNSYAASNPPLQVGKKPDSYKTLGFGINGRIGFEIGKITLSAFFSQGLDNTYYANYSGSFKHSVYGASLGIWLGTIKEPVVIKDKDKDGVPDNVDACPLQAGTALNNGCPDTDADGIPDNIDKCPTVAGLAKYNGCPIPDTDKDGINDEEDKCPTVPGLARYNGCPIPDTDKDGINDEEDKCPTVPGLARYNGCPIPDTDGDGVNDEEDKCPSVAGDPSNAGCPLIKEEIKKQVNFAAENIFFSPNSANLLPLSFKSLDTVVAILEKNPEIKLSVNGYTDNSGTVIINQKLSEKRAESVKGYLVQKGIASGRITAIGYGQEHPISDNKTAEGRKKNRRVELSLKN